MENVYLGDHDNASVEKLLQSESAHEDYKQALGELYKSERKQKIRRYLRIVRDMVLYALALWGLFGIFSEAVRKRPQAIHHEHQHLEHQHNVPESRRSCACGNSTAEAISLGCVYDSLSPAWMQPYCQDAELTAEFETLGDGPNGTWIYYADRNHTQELSMSEVMSMADNPDSRFHVTWRWHVVHCYMYWIKQFRSQTSSVIVEARYDTEAHIRHCAEVFQNPVWGTSSGVVLNADIDDP
ncbi:hypothetical protein B0O99DRAFT_600805 [Bisporella sp. PMI_857]|nr:hypothetical protein B0O99DRAFT_600805 [Bisporella sp. PMI_857]